MTSRTVLCLLLTKTQTLLHGNVGITLITRARCDYVKHVNFRTLLSTNARVMQVAPRWYFVHAYLAPVGLFVYFLLLVCCC
jgi:hypothetical protein